MAPSSCAELVMAKALGSSPQLNLGNNAVADGR